MQNGAKIDLVDGHGRSPLMHAVLKGQTAAACAFLKVYRIYYGFSLSLSPSREL